MKNKLDLNNTKLTLLSSKEANYIDGGDYASGHAAGVYVRKLVDEWFTLDGFLTAAKYFKYI